MSIYEYDQARHLKQEREDAWQEGRSQGLQEGRSQGLQEGRSQGLQEGRSQGLQEGRSQGLKEGLQEGKQSVAANLSRMGLSEEQIAQAVGENLVTVRKWLE